MLCRKTKVACLRNHVLRWGCVGYQRRKLSLLNFFIFKSRRRFFNPYHNSSILLWCVYHPSVDIPVKWKNIKKNRNNIRKTEIYKPHSELLIPNQNPFSSFGNPIYLQPSWPFLVGGIIGRAIWASGLLLLAAPGTVVLSPLFLVGE